MAAVIGETGTTRPPAPLACAVPAAARMLSVSRSQLYRLLATGELRAVKIGHRTVVAVAELERFLRTRPAYPAPDVDVGPAA